MRKNVDETFAWRKEKSYQEVTYEANMLVQFWSSPMLEGRSLFRKLDILTLQISCNSHRIVTYRSHTCTFFLIFESSEGPPADSFRNLFSDFLKRLVISWVSVSILCWSSLPSPNDGINALAWAFDSSAIFPLARWTFTVISSDKSTQAGGRPTVRAPLLQKINIS